LGPITDISKIFHVFSASSNMYLKPYLFFKKFENQDFMI